MFESLGHRPDSDALPCSSSALSFHRTAYRDRLTEINVRASHLEVVFVLDHEC